MHETRIPPAGPPPSLGAEETLRLWEQAGGLVPAARALLLAAAQGADTAGLPDAPVGECNRRLLSLRSAARGPVLAATAACPACGSRLEFEMDAPTILEMSEAAQRHDGETVCRDGGYVATWRVPTLSDLSFIATQQDSDPTHTLLRRCIAATDREGRELDPATLPVGALAEVENALAQADPLAEVLMALSCPDCGTDFDADIDIVSFLWAEVDARARRVLHEVDVLARAYGWTEPEVLALSETRRAAYLRIVLEGAP